MMPHSEGIRETWAKIRATGHARAALVLLTIPFATWAVAFVCGTYYLFGMPPQLFPFPNTLNNMLPQFRWLFGMVGVGIFTLRVVVGTAFWTEKAIVRRWDRFEELFRDEEVN